MKKQIVNFWSLRFLIPVSLVFCFVVLTFSSCNKDKNEEDDKLSNTDLLCKQWSVATINDTAVFEWDELQAVILGFESDGDYKETWIYDVDDIEEYYGKWEWQYNEERIYFTGDVDFEDVEIKRLTQNELWFEVNDYGTYLIKCVPK